MRYYRYPVTGDVFAFESQAERERWGAPELVEMNSAEVLAHLQAVSEQEPDYAAQIEALEREHMAPKWQRDFTLGAMEREAVSIGAGQGLTPEQSIAVLRAGNPGYRKLKELDEQIAALRALM